MTPLMSKLYKSIRDKVYSRLPGGGGWWVRDHESTKGKKFPGFDEMF